MRPPDEYTEMKYQVEEDLIWKRPNRRTMSNGYRHTSGKLMVNGHIPQDDNTPTLIANLLLVDTGASKDGILSAVDIHSMTAYQVTQTGVTTHPIKQSLQA